MKKFNRIVISIFTLSLIFSFLANINPIKVQAQVAYLDHKQYVSAGTTSLVLTDDGVLYAYGQIGMNSTTGSSYYVYRPKQINTGIKNIYALDECSGYIAGKIDGSNYITGGTRGISSNVITEVGYSQYISNAKKIDSSRNNNGCNTFVTLKDDGSLKLGGPYGYLVKQYTEQSNNEIIINETGVSDVSVDDTGYSVYIIKDNTLYARGLYGAVFQGAWTNLGITDVIKVESCNYNTAYVLKSNGQVYKVTNGVISTNPLGISNVVEISCGCELGVSALDSSGNVYWVNENDQVIKLPSATNVIDIDVGPQIMYVKNDGTVWVTNPNNISYVQQLLGINVFPQKYVKVKNAVLAPNGKVHRFDNYESISVLTNNASQVEQTYGISTVLPDVLSGKTATSTQTLGTQNTNLLSVIPLEDGKVAATYYTWRKYSIYTYVEDANGSRYDWVDKTDTPTIAIVYYSWDSVANRYVYNSKGDVSPVDIDTNIPLSKNSINYMNENNLPAFNSGTVLFYIKTTYSPYDGEQDGSYVRYGIVERDKIRTSNSYNIDYDYIIGIKYDTDQNKVISDTVNTAQNYPYGEYASGIADEYNYKTIQNFGGALRYDAQYTVNGISAYYDYNMSCVYIPYNSAPTFSISVPNAESNILNNNIIYPQISLSDSDSNTLTCKCYLDLENAPRDIKTISNTVTQQIVNFNAIDISNLSNGTHTLRFEVSDGVSNIQQSVNFTIDKTPPVLSDIGYSSTDSSITLAATATDAVAGLDPAPYRYTIGGVQSQWTADASYTAGSLLPNTQYTVKVEARDKVGNVSSKEQNIYTKAQVPSISTNSPAEKGLSVVVADNNPSATQYQLMFNSMYVAQNGYLAPSPEWITLTGKKINIEGLTQNTSYTVKVKAKNSEGVETAFSNQITGSTLAAPPTNITFNPSQTSITIKWDVVPGALSYNVKADGVNGVDMKNITGTSYTHTGLTPETSHSYSVSVNNAAGTGRWSDLVEKDTYPYPPAKPVNLAIKEISQKYITLSWEPSVKATEYIVEANGAVIGTCTGTSMTHENLSPDTKYTYRVKARNIGGESEWSDAVSETTWPEIPDVPFNISTRKTNVSVDISWNQSSRAEAYEIWVDDINGTGGMKISTGKETSYTHEGLKALTNHTYRVRAVNRGGNSEWSTPITVTTNPDKPNMPNNIMATADKYSITLTWYLSQYAESYDIEIDGTEVKNSTELSFKNIGLTVDTKHAYRVRAVNVTGSSDWSSPVTVGTLPEAEQATTSITNIIAVVTNSYITIAWDDVEKDAEYLIEVDGVLQDIGKTKTYNHTGLSANQFHNYRVKAKTTGNKEFWCAVLSLSTLPNPPSAPTGVEATVNGNQIELRWTKGTNDESYDVEVDGQTIDNGQSNTYDHQNLNPGTAHTYRVRAKNVTGVTAWSTAITKSTATPEYTVECTIDKTFDFSILASNVQDFTGLKFVITYNPDDLDIVDLCRFTPEKEVQSSGVVKGTKLSITNTPGKIEITMKDNIVPGTSWSGEINNIIFKSKINGSSKINIKLEQ